VISLLKFEPELNGMPILADNGQYPKTPHREDALKTKGIAVIVWQIESSGLVDASPSGNGIEEIAIPIVIEENVVAAQSLSGAQLQAEKALRLVRKALLGKRPPNTHGIVLRSDDPPFRNFGLQNGSRRIVAILTMRLPI
jgi:hypothetical protein